MAIKFKHYCKVSILFVCDKCGQQFYYADPEAFNVKIELETYRNDCIEEIIKGHSCENES